MIALSSKGRQKTATLASVAQRARVSPITVSRVFAGSGLVAAATRERVLMAARELGYAPNLLARGLVHNQTPTVGVVVLELANPFFAPMLSAIHEVAAQRGLLVVVGESRRDEEQERRYIEQFQQLRIGGIIVDSVTDRLDHLARARSTGTPVVVMARPWEDGDYVATDDVEGGRQVARHLLQRGHRRIGLIRTLDPHHYAGQARVQGFLEVLVSTGVAIPDVWNVPICGSQIKDGVTAIDRLYAQGPLPSALFVTSDRVALGVIHRLLEVGARVPEDVAVVGYDDISYSEYSRVPLTTVAVPKRPMGQMSAEILLERFAGVEPATPRQVLLPPQLVIRASCP